MRKKFLVLVLTLVCLHPLSAQYSQQEVLLAAGLSSIPFLSYSVLKGVESSGQEVRDSNVGQAPLVAAIPLLQPLPLLLVDPVKGSLWTLGGGAIFGAAELSTLGAPKTLQHTLFLVNAKYQMFVTYEVYKEFRSRSADGYRDFRGASFSDVTLAPFSLESYNNPVSLIAIPLMVVGEGISKYVASGGDRSIFATGKTFIDGREYNPWIGIPLLGADAALVAIQNSYEEAYWRGFVYEELKYNFHGDKLWAAVVNNALFALWHIPNQGFNWSIAGVFASGLLCSWAYEIGGVPASGAAHGIVNALSGLVDFSLYGGDPGEGSRSGEAAPRSLGYSMGEFGPLSIRVSY